MLIRQAIVSDIPQIQYVRHAVKENVLSEGFIISDTDVEEYLMDRGRGWVCEMDDKIVGFSIVDLKEHNVWALFVHPDYESMGIGRQLHDAMLDWYFSQTKTTLWLGTTPHTRAELFYRKAGWVENGMHGEDEIKFEMTAEKWSGRSR